MALFFSQSLHLHRTFRVDQFADRPDGLLQRLLQFLPAPVLPSGERTLQHVILSVRNVLLKMHSCQNCTGNSLSSTQTIDGPSRRALFCAF